MGLINNMKKFATNLAVWAWLWGRALLLLLAMQVLIVPLVSVLIFLLSVVFWAVSLILPDSLNISLFEHFKRTLKLLDCDEAYDVYKWSFLVEIKDKTLEEFEYVRR